MKHLLEYLTHNRSKMIAIISVFMANRHKIISFKIKSQVILNYIHVLLKYSKKLPTISQNFPYFMMEIHGIYIANLESELERGVIFRMLETNVNYTF